MEYVIGHRIQRIVLIDEDDLSIIQAYRWTSTTNGSKTFYASSMPDGILMHRLILGTIGKPVATDHINGNGLDNPRCNLRICTKAENNRNIGPKSNNSTGFKGVQFRRENLTKSWRVRVRVNGKENQIGYFSTPEEAHAAYCEAAKRLHGKFARFA
jgi:hypothetical protein